jgi:hypothetical protein
MQNGLIPAALYAYSKTYRNRKRIALLKANLGSFPELLFENGYPDHVVAFEPAGFKLGYMFDPQPVMTGQSRMVRGRKEIHIQFLPDLNQGQEFGIRPHNDTCPVG